MGFQDALLPKRQSDDGLRALRSALPLVSTLPIAYALSFAAVTYAARTLGPSAFGMVQFVASISAWLLVLADLGMTVHGSRTVARARDRDAAVDRIFTARLVWGSVVATLFVIVVVVGSRDRILIGLALAAAVTIVGSNLSLRWYFQAIGHTRPPATAAVIAPLVSVLLLLVAVHGSDDVVMAGVATCLGVVVSASVLLLAYVRNSARIPRVRLAAVGSTLRSSLVLGTASMLIAVYYNIDSIIIGFTRSASELGQYGVAHRLMLVILSFVWVVFGAALPALTRLHADEPRRFTGLLQGMIGAAVMAATPIAILGVMASEFLIEAVFGAGYLAAAPALALLMVNVAVIIVSGTLGTAVLATGRNRAYIWSVAGGALTAIVLDLLMIPALGIIGGAIGTLAAEIVVFAGLLASSTSYGLSIPYREVGVASLAGLAMTMAILWSSASYMPLAVVAGVASYGLIAVGLWWRRWLPSVVPLIRSLRGH